MEQKGARLQPMLPVGSAVLVFLLNFSSVHYSLLRPPAEPRPSLAHWTTEAFTGLAGRGAHHIHAMLFLREKILSIPRLFLIKLQPTFVLVYSVPLSYITEYSVCSPCTSGLLDKVGGTHCTRLSFFQRFFTSLCVCVSLQLKLLFSFVLFPFTPIR